MLDYPIHYPIYIADINVVKELAGHVKIYKKA